jgi:acyl transferase domain-containing protein
LREQVNCYYHPISPSLCRKRCRSKSFLAKTNYNSQLTNKDGKCYTFDDRGAGYGRGEGIGVLVLKLLDRAIADGDTIHAVVVDSGVGHDGKTSGIFLPNADAQESLAKSIYARAGLDPRETLFVEAHGTGTIAGTFFIPSLPQSKV